MGRYLGPKLKLYRRLGINPYGQKIKRNYPPGFHGPKGAPRLTPYGEQLREKQRARVIYNVAEKQMRHYFEKAKSGKELTGLGFLQLLERRFDNVIYRIGWATTRSQARQMVSHCFFTINGKKMNIPSYQVKPGDIIAFRANKLNRKNTKEILEKHKTESIASWLHWDAESKAVKMLNVPAKEDCKEEVNESLVVEYYSK